MTKRISKKNKIGQFMGMKGHETYRRIIDQTMMLLRTTPYMKLSAADVARACDLTPPALYLYFNGIPEIVLARLEEIKVVKHRFIDLLDQPWEGDEMLPKARAFTRAYMEYWKAYGVSLRYRNFMAEQGDERFQLARAEMSLPVAEILARRVTKAKEDGRLSDDIDGLNAAGSILSLIDHLGGILNSHLGQWHGRYLEEDKQINATAHMIASMLEGRVPLPERKGAAVSPDTVAEID